MVLMAYVYWLSIAFLVAVLVDAEFAERLTASAASTLGA